MVCILKSVYKISLLSPSIILSLIPMEGRGIETLLSYHCLTGATVIFLTITTCFNIFSYFLNLYDVAGLLIKNPASSFESAVNKYCVKFRMYIVEYDVEEEKMILSDMFHFFLLSVMVLIVFFVASGGCYATEHVHERL